MSTSYRGNGDGSTAPFEALRRFARERTSVRPPMERCDMCSAEIPAEHRHLFELSSRSILCACRPCSLLFSDQGSGGGKYLLVPDRYLSLVDFRMKDAQWDELMIPVNMVYIFRNSSRQSHTSSSQGSGVVAYYPSPAGAMESLLSLESWETLVRENPILNSLEPDVEALLINRVRSAREHYIVPIDTCYLLVGTIRLSWKGLSGGEEVWNAITEFFTNIQAKSQVVRGGG